MLGKISIKDSPVQQAHEYLKRNGERRYQATLARLRNQEIGCALFMGLIVGTIFGGWLAGGVTFSW